MKKLLQGNKRILKIQIILLYAIISHFLLALTFEYINRSMSQIQDWVATVPSNELERCEGKRSWPDVRYNLTVCLKWLSKATEHLRHNNHSSCRYYKPVFPEYVRKSATWAGLFHISDFQQITHTITVIARCAPHETLCNCCFTSQFYFRIKH